MSSQVFIKNLHGNSCTIQIDLQRTLAKDLIK